MKKQPRKTGKAQRKTAPVKRRGRPATGKRSNPAYRQTLLWLRRDTVRKTMKLLVTEDGDRFELSILVEQLLQKWMARGARLPKLHE